MQLFWQSLPIICPAATVHLLVLFSAGSLIKPYLTGDAEICHCVHLSLSAGTMGTGLGFISTSRRQAGFLHLHHSPCAVALGDAHTGRARPQKGQGTGARSVPPEPGQEGIFMLLDGLGNRCASFQLWGQGETLPLLFVVSAADSPASRSDRPRAIQ